MKKKNKIIGSILVAALIIGCIGRLLWTQKIATFVGRRYDLQGIDVSHFQGNVDWKKMEEQGISFSYIKATEGSSYVDPMFESNC